MKCLLLKKLLIINCALLICISSSAQISQLADSILINDTAISSGHIGISIYEPATNTYLYNYNAAKYFVPASNTKLFTCYAGMKYLGDSLVGMRYEEDSNTFKILGTGDPTFLHPDFKKQPAFDFILSKHEKNMMLMEHNSLHQHFKVFGKGWALDDYNESYMTERSFFPIYGNVVRFLSAADKVKVSPYFFQHKTYVLELAGTIINKFKAAKELNENTFLVKKDNTGNIYQEVPMKLGLDNDIYIESKLLSDTIHKDINYGSVDFIPPLYSKVIYSQPTDSLLKPMMHRSDNFFAEQTLLMVSNEHLGYMNDENIIDTLLNKDLKDVPQKPKWIDGSGLSRYNLFTPQSFVYILNKMKNDFGLKRLEDILPTGGEGSLKNYYLKSSGYIYAKTGSMSNIVCLSGFLITQKNKLLIFSILVNNFQTDGVPVRKAIETFLERLRQNY